MFSFQRTYDQFRAQFNSLLVQYEFTGACMLPELQSQLVNQVSTFSVALNDVSKMVAVLDSDDNQSIKKLTIILGARHLQQKYIVQTGAINTLLVRALTNNARKDSDYIFVVDMMAQAIHKFTRLGRRPVQLGQQDENADYTCSLNATGLWFAVRLKNI